MTQQSLHSRLAALALASVAAAQASVAVVPSLPINNATVKFGDASSRAAAFTPAFAIGVFDAELNNPPVTVISTGPAPAPNGWNSFQWEHSAGTPGRVYAVSTGSTITGASVYSILAAPPFTVTNFGGVAPGPFVTTTQWQLDALSPANNVFFIRSTTTGEVRRKNSGIGFAVQYVGAPSATGALRLSPNGLTLAYPSGAQVVRLNANNTSAAPLTFTVPNIIWGGVSQAPVIRGMHWLDNRYLVALIGPTSTPADIGQIARIDTLSSSVVFLTQSQTGTIQPYMSQLNISGDRNWITFMLQQSVGGTPELSPVVMRVNDLVTTSPGGSYIVMEPLGFSSTWVNIREPRVQQRAGQALQPLVLFEGRLTAPPSATTLFRAGIVRDVSITTRAVLGASLTLASRSSTDDVAFGLFGDLARSPAPIPIGGLSNPGLLPNPIAILSLATTPNSDVVTNLAMPTSGTTGIRLFYQGVWLSAPPSGPTTLTASRVTELPTF
jgi:hypothetical protein